MNNYVTGAVIKRLRESKNLTQLQLAQMLDVSSKAVSKWETAKGLPDISLIEPLAKALGVSVMELMSGNTVSNQNRSSNILRSKFYVCPVCGNIIHSTGESVISCCGVVLPPLEAEEFNEEHDFSIEQVEDEKFISFNHPMEKSHYISFFAYINSEKIEMIKLYPEGNAECRIKLRGHGFLYAYCNKHGLFKKKV